MKSTLLSKTRQAVFGLLQEAIPSSMMENRLLFSLMGTSFLIMFAPSSKIEKAISGLVGRMAFGAMMEAHLPTSDRSLLAISWKIRKAISGLVLRVIIVGGGYFRVTMESPCIKVSSSTLRSSNQWLPR